MKYLATTAVILILSSVLFLNSCTCGKTNTAINQPPSTTSQTSTTTSQSFSTTTQASPTTTTAVLTTPSTTTPLTTLTTTTTTAVTSTATPSTTSTAPATTALSVLAGKWAGPWSNSLGESGNDTLVITDNGSGNFQGIWSGTINITGQWTDKTTFKFSGQTSTRAYQVQGSIQGNTLTLTYVATRLDTSGTYTGQETLTRSPA